MPGPGIPPLIAFVPQRRGALQRLDHLAYLTLSSRSRRLSQRTPSPAAGPSPAPPGRHTSRHATLHIHPSGGPASSPAHFSFRGRRLLHRRPGRTTPPGRHGDPWDRHESRIPVEPSGRDTIPPSMSAIIFTCTHQSPPSFLVHNIHSNRSLLPTISCVGHKIELTPRSASSESLRCCDHTAVPCNPISPHLWDCTGKWNRNLPHFVCELCHRHCSAITRGFSTAQIGAGPAPWRCSATFSRPRPAMRPAQAVAGARRRRAV